MRAGPRRVRRQAGTAAGGRQDIRARARRKTRSIRASGAPDRRPTTHGPPGVHASDRRRGAPLMGPRVNSATRGVSAVVSETYPKRVQLLRELGPRATRWRLRRPRRRARCGKTRVPADRERARVLHAEIDSVETRTGLLDLYGQGKLDAEPLAQLNRRLRRWIRPHRRRRTPCGGAARVTNHTPEPVLSQPCTQCYTPRRQSHPKRGQSVATAW